MHLLSVLALLLLSMAAQASVQCDKSTQSLLHHSNEDHFVSRNLDCYYLPDESLPGLALTYQKSTGESQARDGDVYFHNSASYSYIAVGPTFQLQKQLYVFGALGESRIHVVFNDLSNTANPQYQSSDKGTFTRFGVRSTFATSGYVLFYHQYENYRSHPNRTLVFSVGIGF
ncbi:hypothetical protein CIG19_02140 [Enterobacterales bacterium CwR94]|nr:hypothetical protein CIG19_02140 [Enterobacterales bacterium CwR94]